MSYLPDTTHKLSLFTYSIFSLVFALDIASTITALNMPNPLGYLVAEAAVGGLPAVVTNTLLWDADIVLFFGIHRVFAYIFDTQQLSENYQVGVSIFLVFLDAVIVVMSLVDLWSRLPAVADNILSIAKIGGLLV